MTIVRSGCHYIFHLHLFCSYDMTPGFKAFTVKYLLFIISAFALFTLIVCADGEASKLYLMWILGCSFIKTCQQKVFSDLYL